jgi:hypothetical protein
VIGTLRTTLHPTRFHGRLSGQKPPFFEGWYYKLIDATEQRRYAVIPGIFLSQDPHAFVQVLDGMTGLTTYHRYPTDMFWAADDRFEVHVGPNRFTANELTLLIDRPEQQISGTLRFGGVTPFPVSVTAPGIMGWYAWVPFMECYHGVVSLDHTIYGELSVDGETVDMTGGRGYGEKDWGRSFPEAWIWFQTNHFSAPGTSLTASVAIIPWLNQAFRGFIIALWHEGQLLRFATYTGARIERLDVTDETVHWVVSNRRHRLEMVVRQGAASRFGLLKGPDMAEMGKRVDETLDATVEVSLYALDGTQPRLLFADTGAHAGLEVHNVQERLLAME